MEAEIIAVGTELLLGDILNTNAQFLSRELAALGITVHFQTVVGDNPARLESVVRQGPAGVFRRAWPHGGRPDQTDRGPRFRRHAAL